MKYDRKSATLQFELHDSGASPSKHDRLANRVRCPYGQILREMKFLSFFTSIIWQQCLEWRLDESSVAGKAWVVIVYSRTLMLTVFPSHVE